MPHFPDGFLLLFGPCMDISVGRCLDIRIADDGLNGLDIRSGIIQQCRKAVPEHMRRRAMQVDGFGNPLESSFEGHFRDRFFAANDEPLPCPDRLQVLAQHPHDRDLPGAFFCFWCADMRLIACSI